MTLITSSCNRIVVGLGKTGISCVRYLAREGLPFSVVDSRVSPPGLDELYRYYPQVPVFLGGFDHSLFSAADELIVSPGIPLAQPVIKEAIKGGANAIGDIELFSRAIGDKPVIAITGSNGKSTVTSLLGAMAHKAGINVAVGGNIGTPALSLINNAIDLYILELSSFQLETTASLRAAVATVLNISPDHMDRYESIDEYYLAKQKIYRGCRAAVYNLDDPLSAPLLPELVTSFGFTAKEPDLKDFGIRVEKGATWLCKGTKLLLDTSSMKIYGRHNHMNALAALALGESVNMPLDAMLQAIRDFSGLEHRCQWLADIDGVQWFNDSKATNVGASIASIKGLGSLCKENIILIAGGEGKGADFTELQPIVKQYVRHLILIGCDAKLIKNTLSNYTQIKQVDSIKQAVQIAETLSCKGDIVLLAPACASFDMFNNFEDRGDQFNQHVYELLKRPNSQCQ